MKSPTVSIVTATYNRGNVLGLTIESLLRSTLGDWEMIVVGDACTDDTEAVVRGFDDPRLRFVNLPVNQGEQSAPNNEGIALARGRFIAILNHDDLWTSDHLSVTVGELEGGDCDLVFTLTIAMDERRRPLLFGAADGGVYAGYTAVPASSWVFRRELAERVGPWRSARRMFGSPSQDWLFRAMKLGAKMRGVPKVTVLAVLSGGRAGSYAERHSADNEHYARLLRDDPAFLERELTHIAAEAVAREGSPRIGWHLDRAARNVVRRMAVAFGAHPAALRHAVLYGRRGGFIDALRRTRGLPPLGAGRGRTS